MGILLKYISYWYLESKRSAFELVIFLNIAYVIVYITKYPKKINSTMRGDIQNSDLKTLLRRVVWILNHSKIPFNFKKDPSFDFTSGMESSVAQCFFTFFLKKRFSCSFDKAITLSNLALTSIEGDLSPGETISIENEALKYFDKKYLYYLNESLNLTEKNNALTLSLKKSPPKKKKQPEIIIKLLKKLQQRNENNLLSILDLCEAAGIQAYPSSGTLLGIIRENQLLPHDIDIDIGLFGDTLSIKNLLIKIKSSKNMSLRKIDYLSYRKIDNNKIYYSKSKQPILIKISNAKGLHIDMFICHKEDDTFWLGATAHKWEYTPFALEKYLFKNKEILVPKNYDLYLTENYGTWHKSKFDFDSSLDTENIKCSGTTKSYSYLLKLSYSLSANGHKSKAKKYLTMVKKSDF